MSFLKINFALNLILIISIIEINAENVDNERISKVRKNVLAFAEKNSEFVHPIDVERVKTKDYIIEKYILDNENDEKAAEKAIIESLEYFKTEGITEMNDNFFPAEFYATGSFFIFGSAKSGQPVFGIVGRCLQSFSQISPHILDLAQKYFYYLIKKIKTRAHKKDFIVHCALRSLSLENLEFRFIKNVITYINKHSPRSPSNIYGTDLNSLVETAVNQLIQFFNSYIRDCIKFIQFDAIEEWISLDEIPVYAGGRNKSFIRIPEGVKSGKCLPHLKHIPNQIWDKFREANKVCISEGLAESGKSSLDEYLGSC